MAGTPDVRPVGDLPNEIGKTAARALSLSGVRSLEQAAHHSREELLAIHGVGPKAIRILEAALAVEGLALKDS
jgi:hypothetical protein